MAGMDLVKVAEAVKDIDFVMLHTHAEDGEIAGRPMSNNRDVEYDGDSWFFVDQESRTYVEVSRNANVTLSIQGSKGLLGKPPLFLSIEGQAEIVEDRAILEDHWDNDLNRWWPDGPSTPGVALLKVSATRIHYWNGEDEGEVPLA